MTVSTGQAANHQVLDGFPPVQLIEQVNYYPITGNSARQINAHLAEHARQFDTIGNGTTRSRFEIDRDQRRSDGHCELASLQVRVIITTTLPRWRPERAASASLQEQWRQSANILQRHEAGHRDHALAEARRLRKTLLVIGPKPSCLSLDAAMDFELQWSMQRLNRKDANFDHRSWNGLRDDPLDMPTPIAAPQAQPRQRVQRPYRKLLTF